MVTQSSAAYHGNSAMQLQIVDYNGNPWGAFANSDTFSVSGLGQNPAGISCYYQHTAMGDAVFIVNIIAFYEFGSFLMPGGYGIDTLQVTSNYTRFVIAVEYASQITALNVTINIKVHSRYVDPLLDEFRLSQNYPNPFNPLTAIGYRLAAVSQVELAVYNLPGQRVATLVSEQQKAGDYQVQWNASDFASGIYYYQLLAGKYRKVRKMILLR